MTRKFDGDELVIASHNQGKVREISALLEPYIGRFTGVGELGLPEPEETGGTFEANATIKALAAAKGSGKPALADDSGLCVNALDGRPGVDSALWGGPEKDFKKAMQLVQDEMGGAADTSAYFVCVLALAWPDGHVETFRGEVHGHLEFPPRGDRGFGYDPIFVPKGYDVTFAEIDLDEKQKISHRSRAFEKLVQQCLR